MSGLWRETGNHDLSEVYDVAKRMYPKDFVKGIYLETNAWFLKFESGWQIGKFYTLEEAITYALEQYREHIRMV